MIRNKLINEDAPSQATLAPKSTAYDNHQADVDAAIAHFQQLNQNQKVQFWNYLEKVFNDSAWSKHSDRKGKNLPSVDQRFDKENESIDFRSVAAFLTQDELEEQLDQIGFTSDAREKLSEIFYRVVNERLNSEDPFRQSIQELLVDYCPSPFISEENLNVAETLSLKLQMLEHQLQMLEVERESLLNDPIVQEGLATLEEETNYYRNNSRSRQPKRSTIEEHLNTPDENNVDNFYNESQQHVSKQMERYLNHGFGGETT